VKLGKLKYGLLGVYSGGTPPAGDDRFYSDSGTPFVSIADMSREHPITSARKCVTDEGLAERRLRVLPPGTTLLSMYATIGLPNRLAIPATISQAIIALFPRDKLDQHYLYYWLLHLRPQFAAEVAGSAQGNLNAERVKNAPLRLPDLPTQKAIAAFLDRETARIDALIEKKQRMVELLGERVKALADEALRQPRATWVRFEHLAQRVRRPAVLSDHEQLVRLGLYNRGRGVFSKPAADEDGMGASDFFFVEEDDLIVSGQFAWEGAVAIASDEHTGCVVSHRYPLYQGRNGANSAFLLTLLRSEFGDFLLNEASRGSAGRNRPLNTWRLEKEKVPYSSDALNKACSQAITSERMIKASVSSSIDRLKEYRSTLITAAVTGQIDVETWRHRDEGDRRLDDIQKEMAG
jgi:hypothetical protein